MPGASDYCDRFFTRFHSKRSSVFHSGRQNILSFSGAHVIQRIPCYIEGLKNYLLSSCTFDELEQYYINLNELLLSDIDDLVGLFNDAEYKLSDDVRDKLLSRGLIKNDLDTKTEENLDELLGNIRNSLNNSYKSGWEDMWRDSIEVSYEVSKWGSKFLAFFSKIDLALDEEIK